MNQSKTISVNAGRALSDKILNTTVIVAALGYFVDLYDLVLFGVVRKSSLEAIGIFGDAQKPAGDLLFNFQMAGMLIGGLIWGIFGDKKGRRSVLFGSIIMYSLANILNGFVAHVPGDLAMPAYSLLRFIAGVGLAGELGAGITLVNETMSAKNRGWGTMIIVSIGALGAATASWVANIFGNWQIAYFVGGGLGCILLLLRISVFESGMYEEIHKNKQLPKGNFLQIFKDKTKLVKYLSCIGLGIPIWFTIGVLVFLSGEFAPALGVEGTIKAGNAIAFSYIGLSIGDFINGWASQHFKNRKKVLLVSIILSFAMAFVYVNMKGLGVEGYYLLCLVLGCASGFWVTFITIASESFGTNLRATVTTTVPNFVRGLVIPIMLGFRFFEHQTGSLLTAAIIINIISFLLAMLSLRGISETFGKDLDYTE